MEIEVIEMLENKIEQLERDVSEVKELLRKVKERYYIPIAQDGSVRYFPSLEPISPQAAQDFKKAAELALELIKLPKRERDRLFFENMEAIRRDAIEKGYALEREEDAAIRD